MKLFKITLFLFLTIVSANAAVKTWDGGGANSNLATAANWVGDLAPTDNDDLVFPDGDFLPVVVINNNIDASTVFRSITFEGRQYTINGNNINITNGITTNRGVQTINARIILSGESQEFTQYYIASSITYADISLGTTNLTFTGDSYSQIGNLSGTGRLTIDIRGYCGLNGGTGFTGSIIINSGEMNLNADLPDSDVVVNGGVFAPQSSVVRKLTSNTGGVNLAPYYNQFPTLLKTSDLFLSTNSSLWTKVMKFNGVVYNSQLNVAGNVTIDNSYLSVGENNINGWYLPLNVPLTIINNDGADPVVGTFLGLPEGSTINRRRGSKFRISYVGGTGNDVTLTRVNFAPFDFDGDGKSDLAVFTPATKIWSINQSSDNSVFTRQFGLSDDILTPADYDGDFKADFSVFRPSAGGVWYQLSSVNGGLGQLWGFGTNGDIPVPANYNGLGGEQVAVYRLGTWYWQYYGNQIVNYGIVGDKPVVGDYNGDGYSDLAVFRPSTGVWYIRRSLTQGNPERHVLFGIETDVPVPADYDGDGTTDIAVFRASDVSGQPDFYILQSSDKQIRYVSFGSVGDIPQTGDFDGDGKIDIAVFRPSNNTWYLLQSTSGFSATAFGQSGDKPLSSAYIN
jgi:FG-GAP-like repeat